MAHWLPDRELVFIDMPKTGSHWVGSILASLGGMGAYAHQPAWAVPFGGRKILTYRDPWSWYGSLYTHSLTERASRSRLLVTTGGTLSFKDALRVWTHPAEDPRDLFGWFLPIQFHMQVPFVSRERLLSYEGGLWSWLFSYFAGDAETWGRPNELRWGVDILLNNGHLTEELGQILGERLHGERPRTYAHLYDAEMRSWVSTSDAWGLSALSWREGRTDVVRGSTLG